MVRKLLSIHEAAARLGQEPLDVLGMVRSGRLRGFHVDGVTTAMHIEPVVAMPAAVARAIERSYGPGRTRRPSEQ